MHRPAPPIARSFIVVVLSLLLLFPACRASAGAAPENVLVVVNNLSSVSRDIANYYASARKIPQSNTCYIKCSTSELVTRSEFETNVLAPIRAFLQTSPAASNIDYIVLTKEIPLSVDYGYSSGPLSVTSILTCLGEPSITQYIENPYGPLSGDQPEAAFSHKLDLDGYHLYLVTRLDGYTVSDVHKLIDRSVGASAAGPILLDMKDLGSNPSGSNIVLNQRLFDTNDYLVSAGIPTIFDNTATFLANQTGLMGYFSWGSNDSAYTLTAYRSNTFAPGGIGDTYVSSSGRTFNSTTGGQSLVADLIAQGACGVCGNVSEPYTAYTTYPDILFERYTSGFNLAESFYAAAPMLFWKSVVVGDPLLAPYAIPPAVTVNSAGQTLTGVATVCAAATDPKGISEVDFFFDGSSIGSCTAAPYCAQVDTTQYPVGNHTVTVKATDASPAASIGWASATVVVQNVVSALRMVSDAFQSPDGQAVTTVSKPVTAGTAEMGGSEFYIEEYNGASAIRVASSVPVQEGDVVTISGSLGTDSGERTIEATSVQIQQQMLTLLRPMAMANKAVGGHDLCANTKGVTGGLGLRNIGLLIRVYGTVSYSGGAEEDFFYIDDGSSLADGSGHTGLKVKCRNLTKPAQGAAVIIAGISSCEPLGTTIIPVVKVRRQPDIVVVRN